MKTVLRAKAEKMNVTEKIFAGFPDHKVEILIEEPMANDEKPIWIVKSGHGVIKKCRSSKAAEEAAMAMIDSLCSPFYINRINILWRGVRSTQTMSR